MSKVLPAAAIAALSLLVLAAVWVLIVFVPFLSSMFSQEFAEYALDRLTIQVLLSAPVVFAIALLVLIIGLLRKVAADRMLNPSVNKWVQMLSLCSLALAISFFTLLSWLAAKNTLPPILLAVLSVSFLLALAVSLVTAALHGLLKKATAANLELEAVI